MSLSSIISTHISTLYWDIVFSPTLSAPPKPEHGEYCFGVFTLAKPLGKSPNQIAEEIAGVLRKDTIHFTQINTIGGYVNLSCAANIWMDILSQVENQQQEKKNETIVVDYIGANAGKPLHIGHICTPSIGQAICNIYRHLGYDVIWDSHFGDWGGIFGKLIAGYKLNQVILWKYEWDDKQVYLQINEKIKTTPLPTEGKVLEDINRYINISISGDLSDPLDIIRRFYTTITYFAWIIPELEEQTRIEYKKLSDWDKKNIDIWKDYTSISITETEKKLALLNIKATYNIGESFYEWLDLPRPNNELYPLLNWENGDKKCTMKDIVRELIEKWVATQNEDGSVGVIFPEESKIPSCVLQKKDGTGLYLTSDLAAIKYRMINGWNPSKIIYCVDVRQQLHLRQAIWIAKRAWPELENVELFHAFNGFIKLKEWAMSTRHGTVIFLEDLITEGENRTSQLLAEKWRTGDNALSPEDIEAITIGAIKYSYLSQDREKDVTFDWDKALSFEGNSGPYIQYACVRAAKVASLRHPEVSENSGSVPVWWNGSWAVVPQDDRQLIFSPYDTALIRILAEMENKIQTTADTYKPHTLALYCYDLAVCFNSFYVHTPKILEETDESLKNLRLTLCRLTHEKLTLGFDLLAIRMPSEM